MIESMVDPDAEAVLLAIEGKPQIDSLWISQRRTHLDNPLVARLTGYTPLGKPLMVHYLCVDSLPVWKRQGGLVVPVSSTCGHEWVCDLNYLLSDAWKPFTGCKKCGWQDPGIPVADMDGLAYFHFTHHNGQTDQGDFGCLTR